MSKVNGHWRKVAYDTWDVDGLVIRSKLTGDVICEPNSKYEFILSVLPDILYALGGCSDWFGDNIEAINAGHCDPDPEVAQEIHDNVERVYKLLADNQGQFAKHLEIVK